jgi:tetratricopeptide (TPR) repeat protein
LKRQWKQALVDLDQAIRLKPDEADLYIRRASVREKSSDLDLALADFDYAISLRGTVGRYYCLRGAAYAQKGDCVRLSADWLKASELQEPCKQEREKVPSVCAK